MSLICQVEEVEEIAFARLLQEPEHALTEERLQVWIAGEIFELDGIEFKVKPGWDVLGGAVKKTEKAFGGWRLVSKRKKATLT